MCLVLTQIVVLAPWWAESAVEAVVNLVQRLARVVHLSQAEQGSALRSGNGFQIFLRGSQVVVPIKCNMQVSWRTAAAQGFKQTYSVNNLPMRAVGI